MPVVKITHRIGTTAEWVLSNPTLLKGEVGIELTTSNVRLIKIGDGSTTWDALPYMTSIKAQSGAVPVGVLDPATNKVLFDVSWGISNPEVSQGIPVDPAQASTEKVASEKAVSQAIANIPEPEKADDYIEDYYPKTDAEKAVAGDNWWRKWKSGFIEQGGLQKVGESYAISLLVPMSTVNYLVMLTVIGMTDGLSAGPIGANNKRNTLFDVTHDGRNVAPLGGNTGEWQWEVRGY